MSAPSLPVPTLPKGGGAIRGMGETLTVNPARGAASLEIPLPLSAGRAGQTPPLMLRYDSSGGNSPFGLGFGLGVASISRRTDRGVPRYGDEDTFLLSGTEELVVALAPPSAGAPDSAWQPQQYSADINGQAHLVTRYRPRVEAAFSRIEHCEPTTGGPSFWRTVSRDNVTSTFGTSPATRIADPADQRRIFEWLLADVRDDRGNVTTYEYLPEDHIGVDSMATHEAHRLAGPLPAARYLKWIRYANRVPGDAATAAMTVTLDYGEHDAQVPTPKPTYTWPVRKDPYSSYRSGFEVRTWRLCRRILMFHDFAELGTGPLPRLVRSVDLTYAEDPVATKLVAVTQVGYRWQDGQYQRRSLPPVEFGYAQAGPDTHVRRLDTVDGAPLAGGPGVEGAYWVDLHGEGLSGALTRHGNGWWYQRNLGDARLGARSPVAAPSTGHTETPIRLSDPTGSGALALVEWGPDRFGLTERDGDGWGPFTPFTNVPLLDLDDPALRQVDLDGDGLPDLLFADGEQLRWHRSLGRAGFGPQHQVHIGPDPARGPVVVFNESVRSIYLADMTGDGLTDLVRLRNGDVTYWPNLGHGRFGSMVTMSNPPIFDHPEQFDANRLRLGDVDGTGPTDLVYLGRDGVQYWRNLSGNGFGPAEELVPFPACDQISSVELVDLLGTGTACLVWSSPSTRDDADRTRYLDLCRGIDDTATVPDDPTLAGRKPHLLCRVVNNLGAEQRLRYASSTQHYLAAAGTGEPWLTRLPFPVPVVDQVTTDDLVSGTSLVTGHRYWHGYFDAAEREFRGFALTETVDAQTVPGAPGLPFDDDLHLPPVRTRSWYHPGAFPELTASLASGYWSGDPLAVPLSGSDVVGAASGSEMAAAQRALAGMPLRTEVYADDASAAAGHPYTVTEHHCRAIRLQPERHESTGQLGQPAVLTSHSLETLTYQYERNPTDPRVTQALTLTVDEYGVVRASAAVAYRRRAPQLPEQGRTLVTLSLTEVTHTTTTTAVHRLGTPMSTRMYEVTGLADPGSGRYPYSTVHTALTGPAPEIPYEATPTPGQLQRRLVESTRIGYHSDDQTTELPAGAVGSRALPRQAYRLAFTSGLLDATYGGTPLAGPGIADLLSNEAGYLLTDGAWWIPSGVQTFDTAGFYLPVAHQDPFGTVATVSYDSHHLLVTATEASQTAPYDTLVTTLDNDYRTMAPWRMTDPNGNRSWVDSDPLGSVVTAWQAGKAGEPDGDPPDLPGLVCEYQLDEWWQHARPVWSQVDTRERHGDPNGPWRRERTYSDGLGREVMTKSQAEPGMAWTVDAVGQPVQVDTTPNARWVGTGRTVYNNKGLPVAQYEPYFSATMDFEDDDALVKQGVSARLRYDPLGRRLRTDHPDGTVTRVDFDAWQQSKWDANDTVLDSSWYAQRGSPSPTSEPEPADPQRRAAWLAAQHAATPTVQRLDSLGRVVRAVADNGAAGQLESRFVLDIEGNTRSVFDPRGLGVHSQLSDLAGRVLHTASPDAGQAWVLPDVSGAPLRRYDGRGALLRFRYDPLRRRTHTWLRHSDASPEVLTELMVYGEAHPQAAQRNLRGRAWRSYDAAGMATTEQVDFKDNTLVDSRRLAKVTATGPSAQDWSVLAATQVSELDTASASLVDAQVFTTRTEFDALDRPVSHTLPDATVLLPTYNEAGLLQALSARLRGAATATPFVTNIDYDAKGRRELVEYANGVTTRHSFDPLSMRLQRLESRRGAALLQDLSYTYDAVGNVVEVTDAAQQTHFFAGQVATPTARYRYDAVYRLAHATGREHASITGQPDHAEPTLKPLPHPNDAQAVRPYTQTYTYDAAGNMTQVAHAAGPTGSWTRRYQYPTDSNRLAAHSRPGDPTGVYSAGFSYDQQGCPTVLPHLAKLRWTFADLLAGADLGGGGQVDYAYDTAGERRRKVVTRPGGLVEERIYLGDLELSRRWSNGTLTFERHSVHIGDETGRFALVETVTVDTSTPAAVEVPQLRFRLTDQLDSSVLELDETAAVISYEEYHPYGTTSLWLAAGAAQVSVKRYRYIGMERDDETGLCHHGVRQYAPWLGRWISPDPAGLVDGLNRYTYSQCSPLDRVDPGGRQSKVVVDPQRVAEPLVSSKKRLDELHGILNDPKLKLTADERNDVEDEIVKVHGYRQAYAAEVAAQYRQAAAEAEKQRRREEAELAKQEALAPGQAPHPDLVILEYQGRTEATTGARLELAQRLGAVAMPGLRMARPAPAEPAQQPRPALRTEEHRKIESALAGGASPGGRGTPPSAPAQPPPGGAAPAWASDRAIAQHHLNNVVAEVVTEMRRELGPQGFEQFMRLPIAHMMVGNEIHRRTGRSLIPTGSYVPIPQQPGVAASDLLHVGPGRGNTFGEITTNTVRERSRHLNRSYGPQLDLLLYQSVPRTLPRVRGR